METNDSGVETQETSTTEGTTATETSTEQSPDQVAELRSMLEGFGNEMASIKRSLKKATKGEAATDHASNDSSELVNKVELLSMQVAGITSDDEIAKAKELQQETNLPMDKLINSNYFKTELETLRTERANAEATTGVKGDGSNAGGGKLSAEYWIAKGESPTREQLPDRAERAKVRAHMVSKEKGNAGGKFYNS